ncbi:MAG: secondary thiamine-phosphate synthase enzyme YjbQ [Desulfobacterota bacterium]|nr:secondary thiamine-phosphate synthase enzyme YjbQ [Thermodesulfobacteriota bacterium]MDW8001436.1 secondary thiamine-phosphate synthase enzyme YjbQ [Deltaproteobacteria bacterium]
MTEISVRTTKRVEVVNITKKIEEVVRGKEAKLVHVFVPHTTCGITINEDADPNVMRDVLEALERIAPRDFPYKHTEGNADSHIKSVLCGSSVTVPVAAGRLVLGTWQGIFLMEFDGPRERKVLVTLI